MGGKGKEEWLPRGESGVRIVKVRRLTLQGFPPPPLELRETLARDGRQQRRKGGMKGSACQGRPPDECFWLTLGHGTFLLDARL